MRPRPAVTYRIRRRGSTIACRSASVSAATSRGGTSDPVTLPARPARVRSVSGSVPGCGCRLVHDGVKQPTDAAVSL